MSREEAIQKVTAFRNYLMAGNPIWDVDEVREAFDMAIEALAIDPVKWIPCSERLPEPNSAYEAEPVYYLVQNEYDDAMVATFVKFPGGARIWRQTHQDGAIMDDIVAWMPLPEPWRGERGEDE